MLLILIAFALYSGYTKSTSVSGPRPTEPFFTLDESSIKTIKITLGLIVVVIALKIINSRFPHNKVKEASDSKNK